MDDMVPNHTIDLDIQTLPTRHKYKYTGETPVNREPAIETLLESFITEKSGYDRNHSIIPTINTNKHVVHVTGKVHNQIQLSLADLRKLPQLEVLCSLQCAGNRRHTMRTRLKEVDGIDWFDGAVMNCRWSGPRLRDVLLLAGVADGLVGEKGYRGNVACSCDVVPCQDAPSYGGSIPLAKAMMSDADCILALEMNGQPLTAAHGAPVRALFPGILGARSVKWLTRISVQMEESNNFYQQRDYKILPPEAADCNAAKRYWHCTPSMTDMPVNSVVGIPASGSRVVVDNIDGMIEVRGYALPAGMSGPVKRVEVSGDGGTTWVDACLDFGGHEQPGLDTVEGRRKVRWSWCLWTAKVTMPKGKGQRILSKATDWGGNVQPKATAWNLRGVGYNAWGQADELEVI